jgi:exonuclease SbcD
MKLLHTADWHLGDRLGHVSRVDDIRRAVRRVAGYCEEERADVLLIAGDLFSEQCRPDDLREELEHLAEVFQPFLLNGGTMLVLTGNHDNENFCQALRQVLRLAAPTAAAPGALVERGRLYLAAGPTFFRLADRRGAEVQFVLLPYPTAHRYLDEPRQRYRSLEEKHRAIQAAYAARLRGIQEHKDFRKNVPSVLAAHICVRGLAMSNRFVITEQEGVVFPESDIPTGWAYVALGHIHKPQCLKGLPHVRYSGSIERLDLGERDEEKSVVLVDIGPKGLRGEPQLLPLEATPIYEVRIENPRKDLPRLRRKYPDARGALVCYHVIYTAGRDNLNEILAELDAIFPRWYYRTMSEAGTLIPLGNTDSASVASFHETVMSYLQERLADDPRRKAVLCLAEQYLAEEAP